MRGLLFIFGFCAFLTGIVVIVATSVAIANVSHTVDRVTTLTGVGDVIRSSAATGYAGVAGELKTYRALGFVASVGGALLLALTVLQSRLRRERGPERD